MGSCVNPTALFSPPPLTQGFNVLAAHALRWLGEAEAFCVVTMLVARVFPSGTFADLAGATVDQRILGEALLSSMPALLDVLSVRMSGTRGTRAAAQLALPPFRDTRVLTETLTAMSLRWFLGVFAGGAFAPAFTDRVWDSVFYEGPKTLFRTALALFRTAAPQMAAAASFGEAIACLEAVPASTARPRMFAALLDSWIWPPNGFAPLQRSGIGDSLRSALRRRAAPPGTGAALVAVRGGRPRGSPPGAPRPSVLPAHSEAAQHPNTQARSKAGSGGVAAADVELQPMQATPASVAADGGAANPQLQLLSSAPPRVAVRQQHHGRAMPAHEIEGNGAPAVEARLGGGFGGSKRAGNDSTHPLAFVDWGSGVSGVAIARLLADTSSVGRRRGGALDGAFAPSPPSSASPEASSGTGGGGSMLDRAAAHAFACSQLGDAAARAFDTPSASARNSDASNENWEEGIAGLEEVGDDEGFDGDDDVAEDEDVGGADGDGEREEDEDVPTSARPPRRGGGSVQLRPAPASVGGRGGAAGSGRAQQPHTPPTALAHSSHLRYGGAGGGSAAGVGRSRGMSSAAALVNSVGATGFAGSDEVASAAAEGAPAPRAASARGMAGGASATAALRLSSHPGLIWREAQHVSRGLVVSRRAHWVLAQRRETEGVGSSGEPHESANAPELAGVSLLPESVRQLIEWADGERAPQPGDGVGVERMGGDSTAPGLSLPPSPALQRRPRAATGDSAASGRLHHSQQGGYATFVDDDEEEEGNDDALPSEEAILDPLGAAHRSVEPFAQCHRLLSYYYRDARTGRRLAFGLALIEGYWPAVRGGTCDASGIGDVDGDSGSVLPVVRVFPPGGAAAAAPSEFAWDTPTPGEELSCSGSPTRATGAAPADARVHNATLGSWWWGAPVRGAFAHRHDASAAALAAADVRSAAERRAAAAVPSTVAGGHAVLSLYFAALGVRTLAATQ